MARSRTQFGWRELLAASLLTLCVVQMPWRLAGLVADVLALRHGPSQMSAANDQYWQVKRLEARLFALGWQVTYRPYLTWQGQEVYGLTIPVHHSIIIEETLSWNARYAVLAHEAGHTLAPFELQGFAQANDVFAEAVSAVVTGGSLREHARYLSADKGTTILTILAEWQAIYHAAALLED